MSNKAIAIYAEHGTFPSIQTAAFAEKEIDWWDKNNRLCDYCTESFAAYKLYNFLCSTGLKNISLVDDIQSTAESDIAIIVIGKNTCDDILKHLNVERSDVFPKNLKSPDGYVVQEITRKNRVILLSGNSRIAVMYAVFHYLKLQGFSFISPDCDGFVIPDIDDLTFVSQKVQEQPDFITRGFLSGYSDDKNKNFLDWMLANRLNYMSMAVEDYHYVSKLGLKLCGGGHKGMYEYLPPDQPDPNFIPAEGEKQKTYFETHPEWFALRNGKRDMGVNKEAAVKGYYTGNNFCMSNKDAVHEFCTNYLKSIVSGSLKYADIINVWPLDNGKWCECDECKALGNYTRQILLVANTLMQYIKDAVKKGLLKRDIMLMVPAYHETLPEPDMPLPDDFDYDMCVVTLFTIERCYVHDLFDRKCTEANVYLADRIREWTSKENRNYKGDLVIGEYFNVSSFASIPIVLADRIKKDIPDYFNQGAKHFNFMHMITDSWGAKIINNNLYASLLWDVKLDSDAYLNTLQEQFYPGKSSEIKQIFNLLEKGFSNAKYIFHYQFVDGVISSLKRNIKSEKPFISKHVQYDKILSDDNAGIDFISGLETVKLAYGKINSLADENKDTVLYERLKQLKSHIEYGVDMYTFYHLILKYAKAYLEGNKQECKLIANELKSLNENCTAYLWALAGYKSKLMYFDSLAAASWQKQLYEKIIEEEDLSGAKAELTL